MTVIIFTAMEVLAAALVLLPLFLILNKVLFRNFKKSIACFVFSLYLAAVYTVVGLPNITYIRLELNLYLLPVVGILDDLKSSVLNVLMFVPLGITLPLLWEKYRNRKSTVVFGFCASLVIELLQMFTFRTTDINDLITNTLGTFLGFTLTDILIKKVPAFKGFFHEKKAAELYLVCGIVFVVMFLIQPFIHAAIWDLIMH